MRLLRASGAVDRWAVVFGLLLALGPLVQSVAARPCGRAPVPNASSTPEIMTTPVPLGIQGTCSRASVAVVRAVSSERPESTTDETLGTRSSTRPASSQPSVVEKDRGNSLLQVSLALEALRPVVLQI